MGHRVTVIALAEVMMREVNGGVMRITTGGVQVHDAAQAVWEASMTIRGGIKTRAGTGGRHAAGTAAQMFVQRGILRNTPIRRLQWIDSRDVCHVRLWLEGLLAMRLGRGQTKELNFKTVKA